MALDWTSIAVWAAGALIAGLAGYYGAQMVVRVALARLEEKFTALDKRVEKLEGHDIAVLKMQLADARAEIATLRTAKHDVGNLKAQVGQLVSLLGQYLRLDKLVS